MEYWSREKGPTEKLMESEQSMEFWSSLLVRSEGTGGSFPAQATRCLSVGQGGAFSDEGAFLEPAFKHPHVDYPS